MIVLSSCLSFLKEEGDRFHDRPPLEIVIRKFRSAKITAYIAGECRGGPSGSDQNVRSHIEI